MRIWDLPPYRLCDKHLSGEHRELHGVWNILTQDKKGYSRHPETRRWIGKLKALFLRHEALVAEMDRRGWNHKSPLEEELATGKDTQDVLLNTLAEQMTLLRKKGCKCHV